jgi:CheY-like chemotaxis protein
MRTHDDGQHPERQRQGGTRQRGRDAAQGTRPQAMPPLAPRRVLIVDDDDDSRLLATIMFRILGFETDQATDGLAAVSLFSRQEYAVVLMDCQMPVCDGFEATAQLRAIEHQRRARATPIIAVSNSVESDYPKLTKARGATTFLRKPLTIEVLRRALNDLGAMDPRPR